MTQPSSSPAAAEDLRSDAELKAVLSKRTSEIAAFQAALRLAAATAGVGLPFALVYGAVSGWFMHTVVQWVVGLQGAEEATVDLLFQIAMAIGAFCGLYAILQFGKRERVTRESWAPALLSLPSLLVAAALWVQKGEATGQMGLVALSFATMGAGMIWYTFGGAAVNIAWARSAKGHLDGQPVPFVAVVDEVRSRTLEVAAPHGAKVTAITIGMQFLLPGIFYAIALAFADALVVLDPTRKKVLRRAEQLSKGIRGRLFRMWFLWTIVSFLLSEAVVLLLEGVRTSEEAMQRLGVLFLDPSALSQSSYIAQETTWALTGWVMQLALLVLYLEREEQVKARAEQRRREKVAASA